MLASGRSLDEFLRAWLVVAESVADRERLDLDTAVAMVAAAGTETPPPLPTDWRLCRRHRHLRGLAVGAAFPGRGPG